MIYSLLRAALDCLDGETGMPIEDAIRVTSLALHTWRTAR